MTSHRRAQRGNVVLSVIVLVAVFFLAIPIGLHFAQKAHNRLPFDPAKAYPAGKEYVPGEIFARTVVEIMDHELSSVSGWRPNDFVLWGPAVLSDNNANRQIGIIEAVRESVRVMRDHLTKVSTNEYDPDIREAETLFRNDETKFWFTSAEKRYREAVDALETYIHGLQTKSPRNRPINRRNVELIRLFQTWTDLLGDAHASLYREDTPFFEIDDFFYEAQGHTHVMYHLIRAIHLEYSTELEGRATVIELFGDVTKSLERAAHLKPLAVLDGGPSGLFANHRRNLDIYIVDARQKMYTIREELEK